MRSYAYGKTTLVHAGRTKFWRKRFEKMASLTAVNPHAKGECETTTGSSSVTTATPESRWILCRGDAITNESKDILAVDCSGCRYVFADMRFLERHASGRLIFEMFFDGEVEDLTKSTSCKDEGLRAFYAGLQERVSFTCMEYFRRRMKQLTASGSPELRSQIRELTYPDDTVKLAREPLSESFRDAGCMLRFVAVRVSISGECAECLGGIVFPSYFGMADSTLPEDDRTPKWLVGMGITAVVFGVATIYAWAQIFLYGNPLS